MFFLPTYNRPERLANFIHAYVRTKATAPVFLIFQGKDQIAKYEHIANQIPPHWELGMLPENVGFVAGLNYGLSKFQSEPWYGVLCDDHVPQTEYWDRKLIDSTSQWSLTSVMDNSLENDWRLSGATVWGGDLIRTAGFIFPGCTWHICGDDFWQLVGRSFSIWKVLADVKFNHHTPTVTGTQPDPTYQSSYRDYSSELQKYHSWLGHYGVDVIERIRVMLQANGKLPRKTQSKFVISKRTVIRKPIITSTAPITASIN